MRGSVIACNPKEKYLNSLKPVTVMMEVGPGIVCVTLKYRKVKK